MASHVASPQMNVEPVATGSATVAARSDKYGGKVPVLAVKADGGVSVLLHSLSTSPLEGRGQLYTLAPLPLGTHVSVCWVGHRASPDIFCDSFVRYRHNSLELAPLSRAARRCAVLCALVCPSESAVHCSQNLV